MVSSTQPTLINVARQCDTCRSPVESASFTSQLDVKSQRAFEHGRQHAKKPSDLRKAKRCVACKYCKPWKWNGNTGRSDAAPKLPKSWDTSTLDDWKVDLAKEHSMDHDHWSAGQEGRAAREVSLLDLVKPARKRQGAARDYEFIPHLPHVLTFDEEYEDEDDASSSDDWECIEPLTTTVNLPTSRDVSPPLISYASAVRSTKH
ncbi:hypothetical protein BOTBODRAFT_26556 [Botryobasidium botryosum FD-172 SS1]|uniref:Stc1 domain-containing protein n=1 Tax=Botryobasidium botryosum (strain FD-172 SS1) TaxID=930990 RepID=A0A067N8T1_BOTB1|nr:hypothetical protein BOTBODRAFT_26556 [Botryobasidium botryosum FD-172 SS1]